MRFKVLSTPVGEAPEAIREDWIGVTLPVTNLLGAMRGSGVLTGTVSQVKDAVCVQAADAIQALRDAGKIAAAQWWEENYTGTELLFERSEGELIEV